MNVIALITQELSALGFNAAAKTVNELSSILKRASLLFPIPLLKIVGGTLQCSRVVLSNLEHKMSGNYGSLFSCVRLQGKSETEVYLKVSKEHPQTLLTEGLLQSVAYATLNAYGFHLAVPRVLDVLKHPTLGYCVTQEKHAFAQLFADYLSQSLTWGVPSVENDMLVFSVIAQVATYLAVLEAELGMNHRDLTGTNVLMIVPNQQVEQSIKLDDLQWSIFSAHQAILIDFGFTCMGNTDGTLLVQAGQFLPEIDFCPKKGRDLFLLFSSLWNVAVFRESLTEQGQYLFQKWLREESSTTSWAEWLTQEDPDNMKSMYLLTCAQHFSSSTSANISVLQDIATIYPTIVKIQSQVA
jgi:hypothetical protein